VSIKDDPNHESGRVHRNHSWETEIPQNPLEALAGLLASSSPDDRVLALEVLRAMANRLTLPAGTWAVVTDQRPDVISPREPHVWSAHYTQEEALRWRDAFDEVLDGRARQRGWELRNFHVAQVDHAQPTQLRRPDADALLCVEQVHGR
jgi:hypothetical protein